MLQSSSCEAKRFSDSQEILRILRKPKVHYHGQNMSYARMMMIYPEEFFSVSQEENAPEGDPDCVGKMECRKM
jgi:hypothetical protein